MDAGIKNGRRLRSIGLGLIENPCMRIVSQVEELGINHYTNVYRNIQMNGRNLHESICN